MSGLSKISGLPQMKAAWLVTSGPEQLKSQALARLEIIADTYLSMNAPVQWAIPALLEQRNPFQKQLLERVRRNLAELDRQLAKQKFCARLVVEAGWYAVLRIPATRSDEELAIELLAQKNVLRPSRPFLRFSVGRIFGCESDHARRGICGRSETAVVDVLAAKKNLQTNSALTQSARRIRRLRNPNLQVRPRMLSGFLEGTGCGFPIPRFISRCSLAQRGQYPLPFSSSRWLASS